MRLLPGSFQTHGWCSASNSTNEWCLAFCCGLFLNSLSQRGIEGHKEVKVDWPKLSSIMANQRDLVKNMQAGSLHYSAPTVR